MKVAVVLLNLGAPDRLEAVRPFLRNLFGDPAILRLPWPLRAALARLIAWRRAPQARRIYAAMGGASPLLAETNAQAEALAARLADVGGAEFGVFVAMRHWHPFTGETARRVAAQAPDRIVLLPLYPQFSTTTTASSLAGVAAGGARPGPGGAHRDDLLLSRRPRLGREPGRPAGRRDPRRRRRPGRHADPVLGRTACRGASSRPETPTPNRSIARRARSSPPWPGGSTISTGGCATRAASARSNGSGRRPRARSSAARARGKVLVVAPISFVSEHAETLVELDMEYRALAERHGAPAYHRVPAAGTHGDFIAGLAAMAAAAARGPAGTACVPHGRLCGAEAGASPAAAATVGG